MDFIIEAHRGIGPISFGMTREEVVAVMHRVGGGPPRVRGKETECFFRNAFQVSFGDAGRADFIEVASSLQAQVLFAGQDIFDSPADELVALILRFDRPDLELSDPPDSYIFPEIILSLYGRDTQYDYKGGRQRPIFAAVGVGTPNYLKAVRAIQRGRA
jgi:hypothetical protein